MGEDLYQAFAESKAVFDQADKVLGFSLSRLCFQGPQQDLAETCNSQPAILTVSMAAYAAFQAASSVQRPAFVAGLSLGEYSALVAAEALSFRDALYLVRRRGEFMEEAARENPGKMLSVIGLGLPAVRKICQESKTEIANINCPGQTVISGGRQEIEKAQALAEGQGAKMTVLLEVSGAFHSSFMQGAALKFSPEIEKVKISAPKIPVVSNVTARPAASAREIKENLVKQVASSVLWEDSMRFILSAGVKNFLEFGPGKVLKGLLRRIDPQARVTSIENKNDILALP